MGFNEWFQSIGNTVKKATDKIDNTVDVQKLKYQIGKKEEEIREVYADLGEAVIEAEERGQAYTEALHTAKGKLATLRSEWEALCAACLEKEGKRLCPNCSCKLDATADFCSQCGAKLEKNESDTTPNA